MTKHENNNSAKKKLIPAVAMLTTSAVMLSTSTYAWFTMSREVELQNIQMVATVPEDIQISLGSIYSDNTAVTLSTNETLALANSTGWLKKGDNGEAVAPRGVTVLDSTFTATANDELDWSNIADISAYYSFGKLIPASSTNGENIFFTPNAAGVGRTLTSDAKFYQAAEKLAAKNETGAGSGGGKLNATAHIYGSDKTDATNHAWAPSTNEDDGGYKNSTSWNATNDDGYYIDIPVWLRTSSTEQPKIYVTGYVTSNKETEDSNNDKDDLYKAVRVAILDDNGSANKGCLTLADGGDAYAQTGKFPTDTSTANILDSGNYNKRTSQTSENTTIYAVSALNTSSETGDKGAWDIITQNNGAETNEVATLQAGSGTEYGPSTKLIVRVWLEGEDENCWNENAGQDWNIALKFSKTPLTVPAP